MTSELRQRRTRNHAIRPAYRAGATGEANQKQLSARALPWIVRRLTRTLGLLRRPGLIRVRPGKGQAGRLFRLTQAGQATNGRGSTDWEAGGTATAARTWRGGLEKHEADGLAITEAAMAAVEFVPNIDA